MKIQKSLEKLYLSQVANANIKAVMGPRLEKIRNRYSYSNLIEQISKKKTDTIETEESELN